MLYALEMLEGMRRAMLGMPEAGGCALCARDAGGYATCAARDAAGWRLCSVRSKCWRVCDVCCSRCCRPEVVLYALEMLEGMRRILLEMLEPAEGKLRSSEGARGDAPCAALYAGGCGGWVQFRGFEISIVVFSLTVRRPLAGYED